MSRTGFGQTLMVLSLLLATVATNVHGQTTAAKGKQVGASSSTAPESTAKIQAEATRDAKARFEGANLRNAKVTQGAINWLHGMTTDVADLRKCKVG